MAKTKKEERALTLQLTDFIYKEYNVTFLPKYFFINLDKIYKGEYKNLKEPVPVEDLFDMWQKKMDYLNKTYTYNKEHGKDMQGVQRINYDLAILLSKYDSYKRWKEKQKAIQKQEQEFKKQQVFVNMAKIQVRPKISDSDDISSIIDEI